MTDNTSKISKVIKKKRPSKGQATHLRRLKQEARKTVPVHKQSA